MKFGEFLVKRGWVTEEQLLGALIEQERMPEHEAKVMLDAGLASPADLLRAFDHAADSGITFSRSCREQGLWSDAVDAAVAKAARERRLPIGLVLARRKVLPLMKVGEALEAFETERAEVRGIVLEEKTPAENVEVSAPIPEPEPPLLPQDFLPFDWKKELQAWGKSHAGARREFERELDRWFDRMSRAFVAVASRRSIAGRDGYPSLLALLEESLKLVGTVRESVATIDTLAVDRIAALILLSMEQAIVLEDADADDIGRAAEFVKRLKLQRLSLSLGRQGLGEKLPPALRDQ